MANQEAQTEQNTASNNHWELLEELISAIYGRRIERQSVVGYTKFFSLLEKANDSVLLCSFRGTKLWHHLHRLPLLDMLRAFQIIAQDHPAVAMAQITPDRSVAEYKVNNLLSVRLAQIITGMDDETFNNARNYSFIKTLIKTIDYKQLSLGDDSAEKIFSDRRLDNTPEKTAIAFQLWDTFWSASAGEDGWNETTKFRFLSYFCRQRDVRDMLRNVSTRLLQPMLAQIIIDLGINTPQTSNLVIPALENAFLRHLISRCDSASEAVSLLDNLSRSWHHTANQTATPPRYHVPEGMPDPAQHDRRWHPLMREPFVTSQGYRIVNLTSKKQLAQESNQLGHCVRGYDAECTSKTSSHIFSIRDAHGHSLSTFEIRESNAERADFEVQISGKKHSFRVVQHEGKKIDGQSQHITSGDLHHALQEWINTAQSRPDFLNPPPYGETPESKAVTDLPDEIKNAGYYPSWHNINLAFAEFKKDMRRRADAQDAQGRLVFHDTITEDGYRHGTPQHLIDGQITTEHGQRISLRDLNAQDWLRATGLLDAIVKDIYRIYPEKKDELQAKLKEIKAQPYDVTKPEREIAHAFHAGTLDGQKVTHLSPEERATYTRRLAQGREDMPYSDRASGYSPQRA